MQNLSVFRIFLFFLKIFSPTQIHYVLVYLLCIIKENLSVVRKSYFASMTGEERHDNQSVVKSSGSNPAGKPRFLFCFLPHSFLGGVWKKVGSSPASYTKECRRIELLRSKNKVSFRLLPLL